MHESINRIDKIITALSSRQIGKPFFSDQRYHAHNFNKNNFHGILKNDRLKVCFIDGGNASIIEAQNFELSFLRTYFCIYEGINKIKFNREDYYLAVSPNVESDMLIYNAELIPFDQDKISSMFTFSADDETLKIGKFDAEISTIAGIIRRFIEWKTAEKIAANKMADMIVMDGSLQTGYTGENEYAQSAYSSAVKSNVIFSGLSKTSSLFTTTGMNLIAVFNRLGPKTPWLYHPIVDIEHSDHFAEMFAVKLHEHAQTCYRYEIIKNQSNRSDEAISALAFNARDPRYLGYPYGLIDADNLARITERERLYQKTFFASHVNKLSEAVSAGDAHEIINRIVS